MNAKEIRELKVQELQNKVKDLRDELFQLQMKKHTGQFEGPLKIREIKKDIARMMTVITEKERAAVKG